MAGIGFVLKRIVAEETYTSIFKGYLAAAIISSGPWMLSVVTLALLGVITSGFLPSEAKNLFFGAIVYCFAFSLIMTGLLQMPANRVVADLLYMKRLNEVTPVLIALLLVVLPIQVVSMTVVFSISGVDLAYSLAVGCLYASISGIWLTMIFLSAAKRYGIIVISFGLGYIFSLGLTFGFGYFWGPLGAIVGFTQGQAVTFVLLWFRVLMEFGPPKRLNFDFFRYTRKFKSLVFIGLVYNLGVWIDNLIFWFAGDSLQIAGLLHVFPVYDVATFLAFLTSAPAMALFLVQIETGFYFHYKAFYTKLINKASWNELAKEKRAMSRAIVSSYSSLFRLQFVVVLLSIAFAPLLLDSLSLSPTHLYVLRLGVLSVGLHVFFSITMLLLLYFDMRGTVMLVLTVFLVTNTVGTLVTMSMGFQWYGFGFLIAEVVGTVLMVGALVHRLRRLEFLTFSRQPITDPERLRAAPPLSAPHSEKVAG